MSAQRLRDAARVLRERGEMATPGPWRASVLDGVEHDDGSSGYRGGIYPGTMSGPPPIFVTNCIDKRDADFIAAMHPGVALALADWLEAEAAVQDSMQPMAELISLTIEQAGGPAGYVRILHDDDGNPQMQADSSPAALRLADLILGATS